VRHIATGTGIDRLAIRNSEVGWTVSALDVL